MFDIKNIRSDFPIISKNQHKLVYFDNACMSLRPKQVINEIVRYYEEISACAGRSNHKLANKVHEEVERARLTVSAFVGAAKPQEIIFTRNSSEGLNLVANSISLKRGDVVVVSDKEHNSNLVPWLRLKNSIGIEVRVVKSDKDNQVDLNRYEEAIDDQVRVVSLGYVSNLDGVVNPIKEIGVLAHKHQAIMVVDAAQAAPHRKINVKNLDVDFLVFSAHKMCGPSGMGVLYGKEKLLVRLNPFLVGGDTVQKTSYTDYTMLPIPEKFEAGLQDYAGIMGTKAAVEYLNKIGMETIADQECKLNMELTKRLLAYPRIKIVGPSNPLLRSGICSFIIDKANHHQVALMLDQMANIAVRSGQHCVHSWFNDRKVDGTVRASMYFYNTLEEVDTMVTTLDKILKLV